MIGDKDDLAIVKYRKEQLKVIIDEINNIDNIEFYGIEELDTFIKKCQEQDIDESIIRELEEFKESIINAIIKKINDTEAMQSLEEFINVCNEIIEDEEYYRSRKSVQELLDKLELLQEELVNIEVIYNQFKSYRDFISDLNLYKTFNIKRSGNIKRTLTLEQQLELGRYWMEMGVFDQCRKELKIESLRNKK